MATSFQTLSAAIGIAAAVSGDWVLAAGPERAGRVEAIVLLITKSIDQMRCDSGFCAPATPDELRQPIISSPIANRVFQRGVISGVAKRCGEDWSARNFVPMMSDLRAARLSERQLAIAGALHGFAMGHSERAEVQCDERQRQRIQHMLDYRR